MKQCTIYTHHLMFSSNKKIKVPTRCCNNNNNKNNKNEHKTNYILQGGSGQGWSLDPKVEIQNIIKKNIIQICLSLKYSYVCMYAIMFLFHIFIILK